jgi:NADPH-dependent ferric siderophore reductase
VGGVLPRIELPDQHGEARTLDDSVRAVVFSRDMKAGDVVKAAVEKAGPDLFDRNNAVYVVDVKGMPAIIRTLFAMPAMRRRPYKLLVDDEGVKTADFPGGATYPTVLVLDKLRVTSVTFPKTAEELIAALEPAPAPVP